MSSGGVGGADISSQLARIISADNRGKGVPRRVAITPCGKVAEKVDVKAPNNGGTVQEIRVLSEVCEMVCRSKGIPVFPRNTCDLVAMCLSTNACGAWHALYSDMRTGDVDWALAVTALFGRADGARDLVGCLLAASDSTHLLYVAHCIMSLVDHATPDHVACFAAALAERMPDNLIAVMAAHCASIRREMRETILTYIARLLAKVDMPTPPLADAMVHVLQTQNRTELIALFMNLPVDRFLEHRPQIVDLLLARCSKVLPSGRYPLLSVLAHVVNKVPSVVASRPRQEALVKIVHTTLETFCKTKMTSTLDTRTLYACSILGGVIADPDLLTVGLFNHVCQGMFLCAGALLLQKT